jgi:hypothetical protein
VSRLARLLVALMVLLERWGRVVGEKNIKADD